MAVSIPGLGGLFGGSDDLPLIMRLNHKLPHTQSIGGHTVAFSLEWHRLDSNDAAHIRNACADSDGSFGVVLTANESSDEQVIGVAAKTTKAKGWVCAAEVAFSMYDSAIIVLPLSDDHYWLLALCNGVPIPGKDWVGTLDEVKNFVSDLLSWYSFECYGDREFWGSLSSKPEFKEISLSDLLTPERLSQTEPLRAYRNNSTQWLVMGVIALAMVGLAFLYGQDAVRWGMNTFTEQGKREQQAALLQQVHSENQQFSQRFNEVASNYPLDHWIVRLGSTLDRLRLTARGWQLTQLECGTGLPYCLATWSNTGTGTYAGLKSTIADAGSLIVDSTRSVKQTVPIDRYQPTQFSTEDVIARVRALPSQELLLEKHYSLIQALTIIPAVSAGMEIKKRETVGYPLALPANFPVERIEPFHISDWELKGEGLRVLIGSLQKLDPQVFFGQSLKLTITNNQGVVNTHWTVKGKYVAKTQ